MLYSDYLTQKDIRYGLSALYRKDRNLGYMQLPTFKYRFLISNRAKITIPCI